MIFGGEFYAPNKRFLLFDRVGEVDLGGGVGAGGGEGAVQTALCPAHRTLFRPLYRNQGYIFYIEDSMQFSLLSFLDIHESGSRKKNNIFFLKLKKKVIGIQYLLSGKKDLKKNNDYYNHKSRICKLQEYFKFELKVEYDIL